MFKQLKIIGILKGILLFAAAVSVAGFPLSALAQTTLITQYGITQTLIDGLGINKWANDLEATKEKTVLEGGIQTIDKLIGEVDDMYSSLKSLDNRIFRSDDASMFKAYLNEVNDKIRSSVNYDKASEILQQAIEEYDKFLIGSEPYMSFFAISDIHVRNSQPQVLSNFRKGLQDMKSLLPKTDGFISLGDNTQDGYEKEFKDFYDELKNYNPVIAENTMVVLGNHDVRGVQSGGNIWSNDPNHIPQYFQKVKGYYLTLNAPFMPDNTVVYHDKWIGGYHFIALNTERGLKDSTWFSKEQVQWLKETLAEDARDDKPIFVIVHQPLNDTHWRSSLYNGFGHQDKEIKEILAEYPQVIVINGHIHNGFGVIEVIDREFGTMVEVPSFSLSENGVKENGTGYYVAVYEDLVVFRARNFLTSKWLPEYDLYIEMKALPIIYKEAKDLNPRDYTQDSWANVEYVMQEALAAMSKLYPHPSDSATGPPSEFLYHKATRDEINHIKISLRNVINMLVKVRGGS